MQCPVDQTTLVMTDRQGVEIDYCPQCRGVWMDRGELDKVIDRSSEAQQPAPQAAAPSYAPSPEQPRHYDSDRNHHDTQHGQPYKKRKKESFLGELFDF